MFKLQQFSIAQDQCAMKVCTDSLVFGALAPINPMDTVVDIGAGTGLLSLMAKQQGASKVTAIELLNSAAIQAQQNIKASPWPSDIEVIEQDICHYQPNVKFDVVISNPPFFDQHLKNTDSARNTARHNDSLSYQTLISKADQLVTDSGIVYLLLPLDVARKVTDLATKKGLHLIKQTDYRASLKHAVKVSSLSFSKEHAPLISDTVTVYHSHQQYTKQCAEILGPYLLRFAPTSD